MHVYSPVFQGQLIEKKIRSLCVEKKNYKKILQIAIYEKSKNFTVIVPKMKVLGQKNQRGGGAKRPLPLAFFACILISQNVRHIISLTVTELSFVLRDN